ncbi:MAG: sensor histidine kinase [Chloroflexi bacterium]|nr:MAG: sensor histidine kinase [Chloroflexota bacterium]
MSLRRLSNLEAGLPAGESEGAKKPPTPAEVLELTRQEYEQIQKELSEMDILVRQSSSEVEKLAQRNAHLTNKLRTMEANIDTVPRQDIKEVYTAAQESQMRLFMMRGQVEQLQSRQEGLKRYAESLRQVLDISSDILEAVDDGAAAGPSGPTAEGLGIIKIIDAQENERRSLANRLHDGPAQSLTNLILQAEICERLFDTDPVRARTELTELKSAVSSTFQKVREFIFDLRPMMLDDLGLNPTLKKSIEDYEQKTGIACNLTISGNDQRLPPHTEVTIFRIIQQLLQNVQKHAQSTHIQISLNVDGGKATVVVEDDGRGFDVQEAMYAAEQRKTIGLISMKERVEMLGGELKIESAAGKGTRVEFWLPAY